MFWNKKNDEHFDLKTNVAVRGARYVVSTVNTFDRGLETMVFMYRPDGTIDYADVYSELHADSARAQARHAYIVGNLALLLAPKQDE